MTDGAPREAYADPEFVIVRMTAVKALGSWEAAGCFQRIAWRCERDGEWTATMQQIADEIGVSVRTAKRITTNLRERGWVTSERVNAYDATLTWKVVWAGQPESANLAPSGVTVGHSGEGHGGPVEGAEPARSESANVALSSSKTEETEETNNTSGEPDERRDLNEGREDVDRVCAHLAQRLRERDVTIKDPSSKRWRDAARLLMDADGRTETQVHNMIDWCQQDDFWRAVVHSLPNLREHYSKMRDHALRGSGDLSNRQVAPDSPGREQRLAAWQ
jgi:hypothetical protein